MVHVRRMVAERVPKLLVESVGERKPVLVQFSSVRRAAVGMVELRGDDFDFLDFMLPGHMMAGQFDLLLYSLARFQGWQSVVELGVWKGHTSVFFAKAMRLNGGMAYGVDVGEYRADALRRVNACNLAPWFTYVQGDSAEVGRTWDRGKVGLVFVDACHEYERVLADVYAWMPHVRVGGYMLIHDIVAYPEQAGRAAREIVEVTHLPGDPWSTVPLLWEHGALLMQRGRGEGDAE